MKKSKCCNSNVYTHQHLGNVCTYCLKSNIDTYSSSKLIVFCFMFSLFSVLAIYANAPKISYHKYKTTYASYLEPDLEYSIDHIQIKTIESNGKATAVSIKGATGAMQVMPEALSDWNMFHPHEQYILEQLKNEQIGIKVGKWYLEQRIPQLLKEFNIPLKINNILICYNSGIANLIKWRESGSKYKDLPEETRDYICKYWQKF